MVKKLINYVCANGAVGRVKRLSSLYRFELYHFFGGDYGFLAIAGTNSVLIYSKNPKTKVSNKHFPFIMGNVIVTLKNNVYEISSDEERKKICQQYQLQ